MLEKARDQSKNNLTQRGPETLTDQAGFELTGILCLPSAGTEGVSHHGWSTHNA